MNAHTEYNHDFTLETPLNNPEYAPVVDVLSCFNWVFDHREW